MHLFPLLTYPRPCPTAGTASKALFIETASSANWVEKLNPEAVDPRERFGADCEESCPQQMVHLAGSCPDRSCRPYFYPALFASSGWRGTRYDQNKSNNI